MTFRLDEAITTGYRNAKERFISHLPPEDRKKSESELSLLIDRFGPVVDSYPYWHPIVAQKEDRHVPFTAPTNQCGYDGLDHTLFLRNAFITCPYDDPRSVIESVEELPKRVHPWYSIEVEELNFPFYHTTANPVLVKCEWHRGAESDFTISKRFAIARILEIEIGDWASAEVGETWETMRTYFLGRPCGSRSSLFVNQQTGQKMKTVWNAVLNAGVFGPIMV